ncbi:hypothetical protein [Sphingopyxis sp.]|uniref:hypothetical protein n=1 Tax=Sphingopyxis sp. TaxID=1908224 RepID=UPI003D097E17
MRAAVALVALLAGAPSAAAQDDMLPDAGAMDALAAEVKKRSWYPDGYYDVRLAAEAQVAEAPRSPQAYLVACAEGGKCFDPVDPLPLRINSDENDPAVLRYGNIALMVSRLRQELKQAGYSTAVYAEPLEAYERALLAKATDSGAKDGEAEAARRMAAAIETNRARLAPKSPRVIAYDAAAAVTYSVIAQSTGPSAKTYPVGRKLAKGDPIHLRPGDRLVLVNAGNSRTISGPGVYKAGDAGAQPTAAAIATPTRRQRTGAVRSDGVLRTSFVTSPPNAEVWLVSAFAFRVCQRKKTDPWDRMGCRWTEIQTGANKPLSGRFIYQVRWPDGTVRKGARDIAPSDEVRFQKVGS